MKLITFGVLFVVLFAGLSSSQKVPEVPALYVFGDSLVDVGNNKYINPKNPADFAPYGIDRPDHKPTGRFSNANNSADYIAMNLGFKESPPPYLSFCNNTPPLPKDGVVGANFASAGSGILDETLISITHIPLTRQIDNFGLLKGNLSPEDLSNSIFLISAGSNDFALTVLVTCVLNCTIIPIERDILYGLMISKFEEHIRRLYDFGARRFAVVDVPTIGWTPIIRETNCSRCASELNALAEGFNNLVKDLLLNLSKSLKDMKYSLCSSYKLLSDVINNPNAVGFTEVTKGYMEETLPCPDDRRKYLFWDGVHPTDAMSLIAGLAFYDGQDYASPINIKQLAQGPAEFEAY